MSDCLHQELIVEIFARLPAKSLLRFRSLSKSYCSLISSPNFIRVHTQRSSKQTPSKVLIRHWSHRGFADSDEFYTLHSEDRLPLSHDKYSGITRFEYPFPTATGLGLRGSCKGILFQFDCRVCNICLWNPSIRRQLILPRLECFPFDPSDYGHFAAGFGFDPITDDYKVVRVSSSELTNSLVETIKTGSWSEIVSPARPFSKVESLACFANGALHWVVKHHSPEAENLQRRYIMTFDLSTHEFIMIELPECHPELKDPSWVTIQLAVIEESLAVISYDGHSSWIWVLREYNNAASWDMLLQLEILTGKGGANRLMQLATNGDFFFSTTFRGFYVYNPVTAVRSRLEAFKDHSCLFDVEIYMESLVLINEGTACEI